jgi:hypothetical protein
MENRLRYLDPARIRAFIPEGAAHVRVELEDELVVLAARVKRAFPLSHPDAYVSVQDGAGKEIGLVRSLAELDEETRALFQEELDRRYFTPRVEQIYALRQEAGMWHFRTETHRGPSEFYVRNWRDSAHEIGPNRWLIHSVDGGRYEIPDTTALDSRSQHLLEQLI